MAGDLHSHRQLETREAAGKIEVTKKLAISRSSPRGQLNLFKLALQSEIDANVQHASQLC